MSSRPHHCVVMMSSSSCFPYFIVILSSLCPYHLTVFLSSISCSHLVFIFSSSSSSRVPSLIEPSCCSSLTPRRRRLALAVVSASCSLHFVFLNNCPFPNRAELLQKSDATKKTAGIGGGLGIPGVKSRNFNEKRNVLDSSLIKKSGSGAFFKSPTSKY